jgi:hypothetical protein
MKTLCTGSKTVQGRNGWAATWNLFVPARADGGPDNRHTPRAGHRIIHTHKHGHRRLYVNNVLRAESYAAKGE